MLIVHNLTHLCRIDLSTLLFLDMFISVLRDVFLVLIITFYANSVDPDQTPCSAASDLSLHWWPVPPYGDATHKWVNI